MRRAAPLLLLALGPLGLVTACASIWGFEEARELEPGSVDEAGVIVPPADRIEPAPDAPGIVCVPRPPEGFQGPVAIFEGRGSPPPAPPACIARYVPTYDGAHEPNAPPGACTCQCTPPAAAGLTCSEPIANLFKDAACKDPCGTPNQVVPTMNAAATSGCGDWNENGCSGTVYASFTAAQIKGGACTPSVTGTPSPPAWSANVRLCSPAADVTAACTGGKIPTAVTVLPYEPGNYCILSRTVALCPSAYPAKRTYFDPDKFDDTRTCNSCSCGAVKGTCGGYVKTADTASSCMGGERDTPALPATCFQAGGNNGAFGYGGGLPGAPTAPTPPTNVSCDPSGGGPKGTFTPSAPLTVCCRQ
jgi:hypothetical protein